AYQNWEYVIVNNRSTDETQEIAERYASRDRRIRICNNEKFVGAIANHNIALTKISPHSRYFKMLQADDFLLPNCLEEMVRLAESNPSIGLVGSYRLWGNFVDCDGLPYPSPVLPGRHICRLTLLGGPYVFGNMSSVLIRSDFVRRNQPFYNEANIHADVEAYFEVLKSSDFGFVHQVLTYTRTHNARLSSFSWKYKARTVANFKLLKKYGPFYLSPDEYEYCLNKALNEYYRMLGNSVFKLREKAFWQFHKKALAELGYSLSLFKVLRGAFLEVIGLLSEPVRALQRQIAFTKQNRKKKDLGTRDPCTE
ncbi:MAG: glycosyltransferase, partial [Desulfobacterales bacterium]|nr:glycosyltransferase [Desulfobacterales bacterium]